MLREDRRERELTGHACTSCPGQVWQPRRWDTSCRLGQRVQQSDVCLSQGDCCRVLGTPAVPLGWSSPLSTCPAFSCPAFSLVSALSSFLQTSPGSHTSVSRFYLVCGSQLSGGMSSDVAVMGFYAASFSLFLDVRTSDSNHGCVFQKAWRQAFEWEMGK